MNIHTACCLQGSKLPEEQSAEFTAIICGGCEGGGGVRVVKPILNSPEMKQGGCRGQPVNEP